MGFTPPTPPPSLPQTVSPVVCGPPSTYDYVASHYDTLMKSFWRDLTDIFDARMLAVEVSFRTTSNTSERVRPRTPPGARWPCRQLIQVLLDTHRTSLRFIMIKPPAPKAVAVHDTLGTGMWLRAWHLHVTQLVSVDGVGFHYLQAAVEESSATSIGGHWYSMAPRKQSAHDYCCGEAIATVASPSIAVLPIMVLTRSGVPCA